MERDLVNEKLLEDVNNFGIKGVVLDAESGRFYTWNKNMVFSSQKIQDNGDFHTYYFVPWFRKECDNRPWYRYFSRFKLQGALSINKCVTFKNSISGILSQYKRGRKLRWQTKILEISANKYMKKYSGPR